MVRAARAEDVPAVLRLVRALAAYEGSADAVDATEDSFRSALFSADPQAFCQVAEVDGEVVGIALWYVTFSTWTGRHGIWLEDLFVVPEHRGGGHGRALLRSLAAVAVARGYPRLEWWVLDGNAPAIGFYRSIGARVMDGWTVNRLDGPALAAVANSHPPGPGRPDLPGGPLTSPPPLG